MSVNLAIENFDGGIIWIKEKLYRDFFKNEYRFDWPRKPRNFENSIYDNKKLKDIQSDKM